MNRVGTSLLDRGCNIACWAARALERRRMYESEEDMIANEYHGSPSTLYIPLVDNATGSLCIVH